MRVRKGYMRDKGKTATEKKGFRGQKKNKKKKKKQRKV